MLNKLTNWWNKDKIELQKQLRDANERLDNTLRGLDQHMVLNDSYKVQLADEKSRVGRTLEELNTLEIECAKLERENMKLKEDHPDMKAEGVVTPWFVVGVDGENELKGLKTYIDWNDAMIQHMKDKQLGYKTDDEMIQHFIVQLYEHVLMLIEKKVLEDSDLQRRNEFE